MAGYKVVLRMLLILIILGAVGFGIWYFAFGGFSNNLAPYKTYKSVSQSEERSYILSLGEDAEKMNRLKSCGVDGTEFSSCYLCFVTQELCINEVGEELFFINSQAKNKKAVEQKYNAYFSSLKDTFNEFKSFEEAYSRFTREDSSEGTMISDWEQTKLSEQAPKAFEKFNILTQKAYELNSVCFDFVINSCLGGNVYGSLKYGMLDAIKNQSDVLYQAIKDENSSVISAYKTNLENVKTCYNNQKVTNFNNSFNKANVAYSFRHDYFELKEKDKKEFFESSNKKALINGMTSQFIKTCYSEIYTILAMGEAL